MFGVCSLLDRQTPITKRDMLPKGLGGAKFDIAKISRKCKSIITSMLDENHIGSLLKSKIMSFIMIIFIVFY